jgi:Flp pilus assembly protein TadD
VIRVAALLAMMILTGCAMRGPILDANGNAATLAQAIELRHADRSAQAAAIIQRALLTSSPGDVRLQGELARNLVYSDPRRALDLLSEAFDPASPDPKLLMVGGVAHDVLGNHIAAQAMYAEALKIAPNDSAILHNVEISKRLAADERAQSAALARVTDKRYMPAKRPAKVAPVIVTAPEPASPTFRERWRLL